MGGDPHCWSKYHIIKISSPFHSIPILLIIIFPLNYPHEESTFKLVDGHLFFHPNIKGENICLGKSHDPSVQIRDKIQGFIELLSIPNPNSALNGDAALLYK